MTLRRHWVMIAVLAGALCPSRGASAQTSLQIPLQFDFLNPGAKSLALGGAFAGLADDATATFANPAGLTQLDASEFSIDLRHSRLATPFLAGGRLSGAITNEGLDTAQGALFEDSLGTHTGPGFVAGVYAHRSHKWVIAGYRHELVRVDQSFFSTGVFQRDPAELTSRREFPQQGHRSVSITGYGASGSLVVRPGLSVGAALTMYTFELRSTFQRYDTAGFLGAPLLDSVRARATQDGDARRVAPTVGVLWTRGPARAGIVYRRGASFGMVTADGTGSVEDGRFRVPHTAAVGLSLRQGPLTIAAEVTRISYSRLREDFVTDQARGSGRTDNFIIDSGTELHVGLQYAKPAWHGRPRFRAGSWFDPDHSIRYVPPTGAAAFAADRLFDERLSTALSTGENRWHLTAGLGLTLSDHLELNAGIDGASHSRVWSSSLILR